MKVYEGTVMELKHIFLMIILYPSLAVAETKETDRLAALTENYARCADVVVGVFDDEKKGNDAAKVLYKSMIKNIYDMVESEKNANNEKTIVSIDLMGKDVLVGYWLKSFTQIDKEYQNEKDELKKKNNWDWRATNKQLWQRSGCVAIYESLGK